MLPHEMDRKSLEFAADAKRIQAFELSNQLFKVQRELSALEIELHKRDLEAAAHQMELVLPRQQVA